MTTYRLDPAPKITAGCTADARRTSDADASFKTGILA
jgi:hypothetical protein